MIKVRFRLLFILIALGVFLSCNNSTKESELKLKERELALKEKELELKEKGIKLNEDSLRLKQLESSANKPSTNDNSNQQIPLSKNQPTEILDANQGKTKFCYVLVSTDEPEIKLKSTYLPSGSMESKLEPSPSFYTYKSSILEVKNFNQDEKYRIIDKYEAQVRQGFNFKNMQLNEHNTECKIISSDCYVFDSYKAASEHRRNN